MYIKFKNVLKDLFLLCIFISVYYILIITITDGLLLFSTLTLIKIRVSLTSMYSIIKSYLNINNYIIYIIFNFDPFLLDCIKNLIDFIFFILFFLIDLLLEDFVWLFLIFMFHLMYICISQILNILKKYKN